MTYLNVRTMALIPVFCDNPACRTVWATDSAIGGDDVGLTMTGNKVGPCPNCGWAACPMASTTS
jgi:hypothetical protein